MVIYLKALEINIKNTSFENDSQQQESYPAQKGEIGIFSGSFVSY